jgi:alpha-methylacyl-CoA racemase
VAGVLQPAPAPRFSSTPTADPGPPPGAPEPVEAVFADWAIERQ